MAADGGQIAWQRRADHLRTEFLRQSCWVRSVQAVTIALHELERPA